MKALISIADFAHPNCLPFFVFDKHKHNTGCVLGKYLFYNTLHAQVRRDFQREGVGLRLVEHCFEAAERGDHCAVIAAELEVWIFDGCGAAR